MCNPANLDAAKELVKKYRSVKAEDVYAHRERFTNKNLTENKIRWFPPLYLEELTGFGSVDSCSLCKTAYMPDGDCNGCIHYDDNIAVNNDENINEYADIDDTPCSDIDLPSYPTYKAILMAKTPEELVVACQNRADYLESLIKKKESMS